MNAITVSAVLRRVIIGLVALAASIRVPEILDGAFASVAMIAIAAYRKWLSPVLGKQCLFRTSCSRYALIVLGRSHWNAGMREVSDRLERCCGNFSIRMNLDGSIELETLDGEIYQQDQVSDFVINQFTSEIRKIASPRELCG